MKIHFVTLGCKLNQSESESMARQFRLAGHQIVADPAQADISVINTCTVTHVAAQKSRTAVRRAKGAAPTARLVVTGCHAEIAPHDFPVADWVIENSQKQQIPARVLGDNSEEPFQASTPTQTDAPISRLSALGRTRGFVKIQDGCDMHCTFCLTRIARGPSRSRPLPEILDEVRQHVDDGVQEVVLTGVHVGAYGKDLDTDLGELIRRTLRETDVPRLRLSSLEPWNFRMEWLSLWENPRLCRHLHISLQSGSNDILRRMSRAYTAEKFAEKVQMARRLIPDLAITTDLIVGFPGETEETFAESVQFVREMNFARAHVFPFSRRPGTLAADMPDQVPHNVKKARAAALRVITDESNYRFRASLLGQTFPVLWEQGDRRTATWSGLTDNYVRVSAHSTRPLHNQILPAQLTLLSDTGAEGKLVSTEIISQARNAC
ncbi:MAG: tRNA (N(6)-L-threonylcarbamoyladenosine(37)-C(2))-methylthiotransferase MtaB [Chloroflexi bacterium]|nr:tRNA (N(6)-L-threonylcarbamoyladenosine(37)-C(2))-methylthiotransferase MtaB [Chloroflexota bacterium]